jgi:putative membrane protein
VGDPDVVDATRRTRLANERTFLAWLRSALTALAVAVGAGKIVPDIAHVTRWPFELLGAGFAAFGAILVFSGARRFVDVERALDRGGFAPLRPSGAVMLAALAVALSLATLALVFVR